MTPPSRSPGPTGAGSPGAAPGARAPEARPGPGGDAPPAATGGAARELRRRRLRAAALVALTAAVAAPAGYLAGRRSATPPPAPPPEARDAPPAALQEPPPADPPPAAGGEAAAAAWSEAELAEARDRLAGAVAVLTCDGRPGRAVFVEPDRALATVPCAAGGTAPISMSGGREYVARVLAADRDLGVSALEVPGAAVAAVPLGAAAELAAGAEVAAMLDEERSPRLAPFRVRGLVSALGVPALRLAGGPRRLAGPVLERGGRLAGLVPHDAIDPVQPSLAVAAEALAALLPGAAAPGARWEAERERLRAEDRRALDEFEGLGRDTELASVRALPGGGLAVTVLRRAGARPAREPLRGAAEAPPAPGQAPSDAPPPCRAEGEVRAWRSPAEVLDRPGADPVAPGLAAQLRWAMPRGAANDLWIGDGELAFACDAAALPEGARLRLEGAPAPGPAVPRAALAAEQARAADAEARERRAAEEAAERQRQEEAALQAEEERRRAEAEAEASWRAAFRQAHERVRQVAERRDQLERERSRAEGHAQFVEAEQLKQLRNAAEVELRHAEADLDELDRQASLAGIPRAWRR